MNNNFVDNDESLQASITDFIIENSDEYKTVIEDAIDDIFAGQSLGPIEDVHAYIKQLSDNAIRKHELEILEDFGKKLTSNMQDVPPEFEKVLIDNFWDLI